MQLNPLECQVRQLDGVHYDGFLKQLLIIVTWACLYDRIQGFSWSFFLSSRPPESSDDPIFIQVWIFFFSFIFIKA